MLQEKRLTLNCTYNEINSPCYRLENIWNLRVAMMGLTLRRSPQLDVLKSYIILLTEKLGMHEFMTLAFFKRVPNSLKWLTLSWKRKAETFKFLKCLWKWIFIWLKKTTYHADTLSNKILEIHFKHFLNQPTSFVDEIPTHTKVNFEGQSVFSVQICAIL